MDKYIKYKSHENKKAMRCGKLLSREAFDYFNLVLPVIP